MIMNKEDIIYPSMVIRSQAEAIELQEKQITQLTNNWRLLEEWLKEGTEELPYINGDMYWREACENVLDKMKEIKEKNNVQDNGKNEA